MAHFSSKKTLKNWEKIIPNQPFISDLYSEKLPIEQSIFNFIFHCCNLKIPKKEFKLSESNLFSIEEMSSSPITLNFMTFLIEILKPLKTLEIGTFVGVGTLYLAKSIPKNGKVITIEKFSDFYKLAQKNFRINKLEKKIEIYLGDGKDILNKKKFGKFNFIFIDGGKENYEFFLKYSVKNLEVGGIIFIDDALFHGDVLNKNPKTIKGKGVKDSIFWSKKLKNFSKIFLPFSNGIMILKKNK